MSLDHKRKKILVVDDHKEKVLSMIEALRDEETPSKFNIRSFPHSRDRQLNRMKPEPRLPSI